MTGAVRAGLAGCGGIASWTVGQAALSGDVAIAAVFDPDRGRMARLASKHGIARCCPDFDALLEDVEFVIVNGPNDVHAEQVVRAAGRGVHCLVQKPLGRDLAEGSRMVTACAEAGVRLGVVMMALAAPLSHEAKQLLAAGAIGAPVLVQGTIAHDLYLNAPPPEGDWRRDRARIGGGALVQLAVHQAGLVRWLLDAEVVGARVMTGGGAHTVLPDETGVAAVTYSSGVVASFAASWATRAESLVIHGTGGSLELRAESLRVVPVGAAARVLEAAAFAGAAASYELHGRFARWITGRDTYPCTGEDALADLRAISGG